MAYAWQSVEEAAVTLGISTRTLHRRISKTEVETRLENGRREVLVCLPDPEPQPQQVIEEPQFEAQQEAGHESQPTGYPASSDTSSAIVVARHEVALANEKVRRTELALAAFQHTTTLLQNEATRARIAGRFAWASVAVLSIGVYVAVGWTASKVTKAQADNDHLKGQLNQTTALAEQKTQEADRLRDQLGEAQQARARYEGELTATKAAIVAAAKKPTTQPGFLEKLAKLASE